MLRREGFAAQEPVPGDGIGFLYVVSNKGGKFLEDYSSGKTGNLLLYPSRSLLDLEKPVSKIVGGASIDGKLPVAGPR